MVDTSFILLLSCEGGVLPPSLQLIVCSMDGPGSKCPRPGGVAGHAGLFGTASDLSRFSEIAVAVNLPAKGS
jgi:hypothetical protein